MGFIFYSFLFLFGTLLGSFASVLVYRLKSGEKGIMTGRSHCPKCGNTLKAHQLIPIFSWVFQKGKCAYCKSSISPIYPLLEIITGLLFIGVGYFLIDKELIFSGSLFEWTKLGFFLSLMFLTIVYSFYDILFLEIPESVLLIANIGVFLALVLQDSGWRFLEHIGFSQLDYGVFSLSTILICFTVLALLYYVMLAGLKEIYDCFIVLFCMIFLAGYVYQSGVHIYDSSLLSGTIATLAIYISFFIQIIISKGKWMGAGDLRIAILMGLLVGVSFAFPAWMITYLLGSVIGVSLMFYTLKIKKAPTFDHHIPFGPFLALGYISILFFHPFISSFIEWYFS